MGKSAFYLWLLRNSNAMLVPPVTAPDSILWNARSSLQVAMLAPGTRCNYGFLEQIKNTSSWLLPDSDPNGRQWAHVCVFASDDPDEDQLSSDRWHYVDLTVLTDDTPLDGVFPCEWFPEVARVWENGYPLEGMPLRGP